MIHRTYTNASNFNIFQQQLSQLKQTFINNSYPNRTFDKILSNYHNRIYTTPNLPTVSPINIQPPRSPSSLPVTSTNPSVAPAPPLILLAPQHKTIDNLTHIKFSTKINFHTTTNSTNGSYNK